MENAFCDPIYSKQYGTWQSPRPLDDHCILHLICTFCAPNEVALHNGIARCHKASNLAWRRFYWKYLRGEATRVGHELLDHARPNGYVPGLMSYQILAETLGLKDSDEESQVNEEGSDEESQEEPSEMQRITWTRSSWRSRNFHLLDFGSLPRPSQH